MPPAIRVTGHRGIGDNLHQRGPVRELMKRYEVYLDTPGWMIYHDLVQQGLKLCFMNTPLHAQARQIERERGTYQWHTLPPMRGGKRVFMQIREHKRIYYDKPLIDKHGSIIQAMYAAAGLPVPEKPDFSLPAPDDWLAKAREVMRSWDTDGKPVLIYRPIVQRPEWNCMVRNPDPNSYIKLFQRIRDKFFVVSVAYFKPGTEWRVEPIQEADVRLEAGELDFPTMAGLWKLSDMVFANAGFGPVLAQAVGTPSIVVYGGRESFKTTERPGQWLAPTLGIDHDNPCDCHNYAPRCGGRCNKTITLEPAFERLDKFVGDFVSTKGKAMSKRTLFFGTFYIDSADREGLTRNWIRLHTELNKDCDFLAVDSQSPSKMFADWTPYDGKAYKRMYYNFPDNIGHLSRAKTTSGKDGWGRAFCKGLEIACELGYEYAVHVEGDSLLRLPVQSIVDQMSAGNVNCMTTKVSGMRYDMPGWIETGLMFFNVDYVKKSNFIQRYNWPYRLVSPTPEVVIANLLGKDVKLMPWKALRADKNQITVDNVLSLNLDWVTHQHQTSQQDVYHKFVDAALGKKEEVVSAETAVATPQPSVPPPQPAPQQLIKLNLGCGTNKLQGWENHDREVDVTKPLKWGSNSASHVFIEHCIEHVNHKQAIGFFREVHRILAPGGVFRVTFPSLDMIRASTDLRYWQFTTKWQKVGPTARGACDAIIYAHGHEMIWNASLMKSVLWSVGFDDVRECVVGESDDAALRGVEGHGKVIGDVFNRIESCCVEARKVGALPAEIAGTPPQHKHDEVAIILGGADNWEQEMKEALALTNGHAVRYFMLNDHIKSFPERGVAVTLHPDKLINRMNGQTAWLWDRRQSGFPEPEEIWSHREAKEVTHHNNGKDWGGSTSLFAAQVARREGHQKIILVGCPMTPETNHFVRKVRWNSAHAFRPGWMRCKNELLPYVRSMSGWTAEIMGKPDKDWLA